MASSPRAMFGVVSLFTAGVLAGAATAMVSADAIDAPSSAYETMSRVTALVQARYVEEVPAESLVDAALHGMVASLDPHSRWLSEREFREVQNDTWGTYTGIGVEVRRTDEGVRVVRVVPGSPAERDGIVPGDLITSVDGAPVDAASVEAALLGPRGTSAAVGVVRDTGPAVISTVRDEVRTPAVSAERVDDRVLYARLARFQRGAADELRAVLERETATSAELALVLDLRDDPGGLLDEAVAVADLFLDEGVIVSTSGRPPTPQTSHEATPGGFALPVVVLVNGLSASASEVVAGALQDTHRGTVVGTRTYGKGSVQEVFQARDGSALKLTVGEYRTPSGKPVAPREGREPDVVVAWPGDVSVRDQLTTRITALDVPAGERDALIALVEQLPQVEARRLHTDIPWEGRVSDRIATDPQLAKAVELARAAPR